MLLLIFGAGASYDSADTDRVLARHPMADEFRPPLAKELVATRFEDLAVPLHGSRAIIDLLRRPMHSKAPTAALESELAEISKLAERSPDRRQQLVAFRFYLQSVIDNTVAKWAEYTSGLTHYLTLLNRIHGWQQATRSRVLLVTFNYDGLLDDAAMEVVTGWSFSRSFPDYINRDDFRLFKLHGSTDWSRVFPLPSRQLTHLQNFRIAGEMAARDELPAGELVANPVRTELDQQLQVSMPALAVPMAGKTTFECPPEHIAALVADMPKVKHVLIVGWRAAEPHAVRLLAGADSQEGLTPGYTLGLVTGNLEDAQEIQQRMSGVWEKGRLRFIEHRGFSTLIGQDFDQRLETLFRWNDG